MQAYTDWLCYVWALTNDISWKSVLHDRDYNHPQRRLEVGLIVPSLYQLREQAFMQIQIVHLFMTIFNVQTAAMTCHIGYL